MVAKFMNFIKQPTSRHVLINTVGNYLNVFFTAFFALLLVRILSPSQYGVLSVLLGIAYVLANILDFGTTATIYSYLPPLYEQKSTRLYRFIKSTFYYQSIFSLAIIGLLLVSFPYLDKVFFKTGAPIWELYLTAFSVLFFIWQNFIMNILFAAKKFVKANIYLNLANLLKTMLIFVLMAGHLVNVGSIIFVFGIIGPIIFFLLLFLEKRDLIFVLAKAEVKREEFRFSYTFTYFIASQFFNLGLRMDLFLLSYFLSSTDFGKAQVGYYGLSQKIILTIMTTIISITQVLSPAFSGITKKKAVLVQIKTGLTYLLVPSALFLILYLLPNQVFNLFFTERFAKTAAITKALSLPFVIYALANIPILFLLYTVKRPLYILISNVVFFIILTAGCYYVIPIRGVMGAPIAVLVALLANAILLTIFSIYEYKNIKT